MAAVAAGNASRRLPGMMFEVSRPVIATLQKKTLVHYLGVSKNWVTKNGAEK
jgi:hypothetical protein